jgi:integration host factor subunit beta
MENISLEKPEIVKSEIVKRVIKKLPQWLEKDIELGISVIMEHLCKSLCEGKRVEIRGFGCFTIRQRASRKAHNPKTGEKVITPPKRAIHFKPGKELRQRVNAIKPTEGIPTTQPSAATE